MGNHSKRMHVSSEQLVAAWMDAHEEGRGIQTVAKALGVVLPTVYHRFNLLKTFGIKLPKLARKTRINSVVDVQALKKMIADRQ